MKFNKSELLYFSSNLILPLSNFLVSLITTSFISPENMGVYQRVLLFIVYFKVFNFGVYEGLNRFIPIHLAKNQISDLQKKINASYFASKLISIFGFIFGSALMLYWISDNKNVSYTLTSVLLIINLVLIPLKTHFEATFRGFSKFGVLGKIIYKENIFYLISSILTVLTGFFGKLISEISTLFFSFILRYKNRDKNIENEFSFKDISCLVITGFPILISGYFWEIFIVLDQTFISKNFEEIDLGFYTLSRLIQTAFVMIPNSIGSIYYPKLCKSYGLSENASSLRYYWKKLILTNFFIIVPAIIILYPLLPFFVITFLPKYQNGVAAAQINLLSTIPLILISPSMIFGIMGKNSIYIAGILVCLFVYSSICFFLPHLFLTIDDVANLKLLMFSVFSIFIAISTYRLTK